MHKLTSRVFPENTASRALLKGSVSQEIGIHRRHGQLDGLWRDCVIVERLLDTGRPRRDETLHRRRRARDGADARLGIELLPAGDPGRSDRAAALGLSRTTVLRAVLRRAAVVGDAGPSVGRAIDNRGGRGVLALSNLVLAAGLVLLGVAQGFFTLALAWAVLGVGMAMGLYDPAFATSTGLYGRAARGPITGITLIAGFASTVGWPLSAFLERAIWLARRRA